MKQKIYKIDEETKEALRLSIADGKTVVLPEELPRELYQKVKKVLNAVGAKWDKKSKSHVAEYDISKELDNIISSGVYHNWKKDTDYFFTPDCVHRYFDVFNPYDSESSITILDPSAGRGHLMRYIGKALPLAEVYAVEINPLHIPYLEQAGYKEIYQGDFMEYMPSIDFDLILMNPPFTDSLEHIKHAYDMLKLGGTLISVAEGGLLFRTDGKYRRWKEYVADKHYELIELPEGTFRESGTMVKTVMLSISKL